MLQSYGAKALDEKSDPGAYEETPQQLKLQQSSSKKNKLQTTKGNLPLRHSQSTEKPVVPALSHSVSDKKQQKVYVLTALKDGEYQPVSEEDMIKFFKREPSLAKFWQEPDSLNTLPLPSSAANIQYESWDLVAKSLISRLWRVQHAKMFHQAVDLEFQSLPDYHEIIKNPIDFSVIKQRLQSNLYHNMQDFVDDMQLVFDNCELYNGRESTLGRQCTKVRDEFRKLYE